MTDFVDIYRNIIVQIATPYSTGTGFFLKEHGLIVTNHHVVEDNRQVVIEGAGFKKQLAAVRYADKKYDLAFLDGPDTAADLPSVRLGMEKTLRQNDPVVAIGHPFGLSFSIKKGIISGLREVLNDIPYLHIDAALNPGNSGGPLVDSDGEVVGINTFVIRDGDNIGFSLPVHLLQQSIDEFKATGGAEACRCTACAQVLSPEKVDNGFCVNCGAKAELPSAVETYVPTGVARTVENMIARADHNVSLSRCGPNAWEIRQGSAKIGLSYHEKSGIVNADAVLCQLPKENIKPLYEYLLRENYTNQALSLSVSEQDIVLSLLIFDRYLNEETGLQQLQSLFEKADHYDDILVKQFGCVWKVEN